MSDEFMDWWKTHKGVCEANYEGSSPAMEAAAALDIWKRSEEHLHLRFTEVIGNGDSKMITMLQESEPYGKKCGDHQVRVCRTCPEEGWQTSP